MAAATTAKRYIKEAARRARGEPPVPVEGPLVVATGRLATHIRRAADHAHMGTEIAPEARFRTARAAMLKAARVLTGYQVPFNLAVVDALADVDELLEDLPTTDGATTALSSLEVYAQQLGDRGESLERDNAQLRAHVEELRAHVEELRAHVEELRSEVEEPRSEMEARRAGPGDSTASS